MSSNIIQAVMTMVVGLTMLMIGLPLATTMLDQMQTMSISTGDTQIVSATQQLMGIMPLAIILPIIIGAIMFALQLTGSHRDGSYQEPTSTNREREVSLQLEEAARRTTRQMQLAQERRTRQAVDTPRKELMELDASALAPTVIIAPAAEKKQEEAKLIPNDSLPQKSRWESLE